MTQYILRYRSRGSFDEYSDGGSDLGDDDMDPDGDNILIKDEPFGAGAGNEGDGGDGKATEAAGGSEAGPPKKKAKKQSRFNGISEEELSKRLLPDLIQPDLDILIVSHNISFTYMSQRDCSVLNDAEVFQNIFHLRLVPQSVQ